MATATIPVSQIHAELSRMWDSLEGAGKMRASLFNLIFYVQNLQRLDYFRKVAKAVIEKFPSRVFLIVSDKKAAKDYLDAKVSVIAPQQEQSDIYCDFIEFQVSGSQENRVPFVLLPHILPDLPIYVVWDHDPTIEDPISHQLEAFATRMIFDSESTCNLAEFAKALIEHQKESHCDIADLNWARMQNWRDLFVSSFYTDERLEALKNAKTMQIQYNAVETPFFCHNHIQALYLQGWLACQLGWKFETLQKTKDQGFSLSYSTKKQKVSITLKPVSSSNLSSGTILSVDFVTGSEEHYSFCRHPEVPSHIMMNISSKEKCELPTQFIFPKGERGQSLVKEICYKGTSSHFLKVLQLFSTIPSL
jgi:hypothetical protein